MWLENLVELKRREVPPPPLPEKQEAFIKGFSFYTDIRPAHHLVKYKPMGSPAIYSFAYMLPLFTVLCLQAWLGRPVSEVASILRWVAIGFLVALPVAILIGLVKGYQTRRRRWTFWEWPDFASFAMEEANAQSIGALNFGGIFVLIIAFVGWAVR